ncbi:hypothetical protein AB0M79_09295 [Polymorphospora sp. NPDC051019]|uniref:hypothetical protein n=1 Tax=Polymorphospora sp. NPDC051019 TaxID=3155725 RepID=UPI003414F686
MSDADLSTWAIKRLEAHTRALRSGDPALEAVRVVAQSKVYHSAEDRDTRLRWALLALNANQRLHDDSLWAKARMLGHAFMLRTWVIEHFGPGADPTWDPETLATDTLLALGVDPAEVPAVDWRGLTVEEIGRLRRYKNLTAHLDRLISYLPPGATKDELAAWIQVRGRLP